MTISQLSIYNGALGHLKSRELASLTEARESRRVLDRIWNGGLVDACLEQGLWTFAMRTAQIDYSPSVAPDFGYPYAFEQPDDYIRIAGISADEFFSDPLTRYADEAGYWFSDIQTIYVRFVSNASTYGGDLSRWPQSFNMFVEAYMAWKACPRISGSDVKVADLEKTMRKLRSDARSKDAMKQPVAFPPRGSWSRARHGGCGVRRG